MNTVYKYCKPHRAKSILGESRLHFSSHTALNDHHDCLVEVDFFGVHFQYPAEGFDILSLSSIRDSQLMWSNYGKGHSGVCLGFKTPIYQGSPVFHFKDSRIPSLKGAPQGYLPLYKVEYQRDQLPRYKSPGGNPRVAFSYLTHKTPQWAHENEYRVIIDPSQIFLSGNPDVEFDPEILEEVIFGQDITEEDQREMLDIIKAKYTKTKVFKVSNFSSEPVIITSLEI